MSSFGQGFGWVTGGGLAYKFWQTTLGALSVVALTGALRAGWVEFEEWQGAREDGINLPYSVLHYSGKNISYVWERAAYVIEITKDSVPGNNGISGDYNALSDAEKECLRLYKKQDNGVLTNAESLKLYDCP